VSLFVAAWPGSEATGRLAAALGPELTTRRLLRAPAVADGPSVVVRTEGATRWHVTLAFLGEEPDADAVGARLSASRLGPARAVIDGASTWFAGGVLVLPVSGLDRLAGEVRRALAGALPDSTRPFIGHLTLARRRGRPRAEESLAQSVSGGSPVDRPPTDQPLAGRTVVADFVVQTVAVVRSLPGSDGRDYATLLTIPLGTGPLGTGPLGTGPVGTGPVGTG